MIACTSRDEINIVAGTAREEALADAQTIVRTTNVEYLEVWRERQLDVDFMVSSELETANAVSRIIGIPAARQTDVFAEGQVQMVEFDVPADAATGEMVGQPLRSAIIPQDSKVASIIRGERMIVPRGDESIEPGDRVDRDRLARGGARMGPDPRAGESARSTTSSSSAPATTGLAIARVLARRRGARADRRAETPSAPAGRRGAARARACSTPPAATRTSSSASGSARRTRPCSRCGGREEPLRGDARQGARRSRFTIAVVHEPVSVDVLERAGIDVAVNPRTVTAEEIVRFAHDPRIRQLAMLEGDRFEILDITVRPDSELVGSAVQASCR